MRDNLSTAVNWSNSKTGADFEAVFPTVLQCFTIIGGGYLARRLNLIGANDLKGVQILIVYFLMPTMIAQAILDVHWDKVNWRFIACVFVAKAFVFVAVAAVTLALSNDMGKAGIYGIFASQSNDMALGMPLIKALYGSNHPEYVDYLYLLLPVSLVVINPIGFLMMELEAQRKIMASEQVQGVTPVSGRWDLFRRVLFGIATNPMIISTIVGLVGSIALGRRHVPELVDVLLNGFSSGFLTVALFTLGCTLVSAGKPDAHYPLGTALLLSLAKILLLPLILRELVSLTNIGKNESDASSLATFGFFYGSLPTAPTVFVFACQYNVAVKQISTGLALVTLVSAPWVYLSCKMISINHIDKAQYDIVFSMTEFNTAIVGIVTAVICIFVYVVTAKVRRLPHGFVFCLVISSIIACTGVLLDEKSEGQQHSIWSRRIARTLVMWGQLSLRLFAVFLAISMTILRMIGLCLVLRFRGVSILIGFCFPLFIALSVVLSVEVAHGSGTSAAEFDKISAYITAVVVTLCLIANVVLLICQYKCNRVSRGCVHNSVNDGQSDGQATATASTSRPCIGANVPDIEDSMNNASRPCEGCDRVSVGTAGDCNGDVDDNLRLLETDEDESSTVDASNGDVRPMCSSAVPCSSEQRYRCKRMLRQYMRRTRPAGTRSASICEPSEPSDDCDGEIYGSIGGTDAYEFTKHSLLVAFLCISMTVSLFVALWQAVQKELESGTFLQLRLLDTVFVLGQPLVVLILFGLDGSWLFGLRRRIRRIRYGSENLVLPPLANIDRPTRAVCEQFSRYQLTQCANDIAKTVRSTLSVQENVFRGVDLVDWLLKNGIVDGRTSAVKYGRRLILGRVIEHTDQEEHFYDSSTLFYRFVLGSTSSRILESHSC